MDNNFINKLYNHRRFMPWYDDTADYNTDAKSYYDYLARNGKLMDAIITLVNNLYSKIDNIDHWYKNIQLMNVLTTGDYDGEFAYFLDEDDAKKINSEYVLYFPKGRYVINYLIGNLVFGKDATLIINDVEFKLSNEPQQFNSAEQNHQRLNNFITGINAGLKTNDDTINSYGNTIIGSESFKNASGQHRNTLVGQDSGKEIDVSYSATGVGAGAFQESKVIDRNTAIGGNAAKWLGANTNIIDRHSLFTQIDNNTNLNTRWPDWRGYAGTWDNPNFMSSQPTDAQSNTAIGRNAQGFNITTKRSVGVGYNAMEQTLDGDGIVAVGESALQYAVKAKYTTAVGGRAGFRLMDTLEDVIVGKSAAQDLTHSAYNTILGYNAANWTNRANNNEYDDIVQRNVFIGRNVAANASGETLSNVMIGENSGTNAVDSQYNTYVGASSGTNMNSGQFNTMIGANAGNALTDNDRITAIGYNALNNASMDGFDNITGVGQNSSVTGSNQLQLGNSAVTPYAFQALQLRSDRRDKMNIDDSDLGLEFINRLRPVNYNVNFRESYEEAGIDEDGSLMKHRKHYGFIAQEVEEVMNDMCVDFAGLQHHNIDGGKDVYSLGYDEFISPLVKAVQELSHEVEILKSKLVD